MAEKKSSNTSNKRQASTARSTNGRKSSGTGSRSGSAQSSRSSASRTSTSSRTYGRTSNYAARKRRKEEHDEMRRDIILVLLFAGMVFLFLSNLGLFGVVGQFCHNIMFGALGAAAYILPIIIFALTLYGMMSSNDEDAGARIICVLVMYLLVAIICDLMTGSVDIESALDPGSIIQRCTENANGGGLIGGLFAWILMRFIGLVGTVLLLVVIAVICLVVITGKPILRLMQDQAADARDRVRYRREAEAAYREEHPEEYEGFLPDEEDDELTENDIAEYRARKAAEREERLRSEARRDVERRHETRNQVYKTFRGIVGDTNLSNDPYVRQMTAAAAVRENRENADPAYLDETGPVEDMSNYNSPASARDEDEPSVPFMQVSQPQVDTTPEMHETQEAEILVPQQTLPIAEPDVPGTIETTQIPEIPEIPEVSAGAYAAQQLLKNQQPGTDGIQLTVAAMRAADTEEDDAFGQGTNAARESVRQAIPIHRESNNLHEINAMEFQGSYAALARNTVNNEEDDEDLTSRIIREGMADLNRAENPDSMYRGTSALSDAADAFSRSTAFTEIQHAYRPVHSSEEEPAQSLENRDDTAAVGLTTQLSNPSSIDEQSVRNEQTDVTPYVTSLQNPDSMDSVESIEAVTSQTPTEPVSVWAGEDDVLPYDNADSGSAEDTEAASTEDEAPWTELSGTDPSSGVAATGASGAAEVTRPATPPVVETTASPVAEMTTPAGSGSALAAQHARSAQIHTENQAVPVQADIPAAAPAKEMPVSKKRKYIFPSLSLLTAGNPSRDSGSDEELRHTAEVLETTLHTFGVNCKITDISQGPAVTRYELLPEQGVKVSKVVGLSDDIKLALAAMDIRIEAPIPGKSAIGIEVPNKVTSTVALRDILAHPNFRDHKSKLAIGIGKDISGQIVVSDLAKMPHVLIAGATGSGKSVCINTIIMSILYHATPEEVKLLMIDPKVVELSVYNGIPHLLYPVVTNPQQAATLLNWAVAEMESRYRKFADARVRDMKGYNQMIQQQLDQGRTTDDDGNTLRVMPRIVVIVDELADLMMVAKNDVETAICRLAQLARAAGIHLIIATQRPSVDVITGLIKANMPSRIAFAVSSGVDSRTILDMNGAEKLLGKGDMLFFPQGLPKPARIQGAFVDDDEVSEVVNFIKENDPTDTEEESRMRQQMENLGNGGQIGSGDSKAQDSSNDIDDYFYRAGKFIIEKDNASIGLLQRGFRIGFNRAARLMDQLCDAGVVAESEGTKSRRILMTEAEFEAYCQDNEIR